MMTNVCFVPRRKLQTGNEFSFKFCEGLFGEKTSFQEVGCLNPHFVKSFRRRDDADPC